MCEMYFAVSFFTAFTDSFTQPKTPLGGRVVSITRANSMKPQCEWMCTPSNATPKRSAQPKPHTGETAACSACARTDRRPNCNHLPPPSLSLLVGGALAVVCCKGGEYDVGGRNRLVHG